VATPVSSPCRIRLDGLSHDLRDAPPDPTRDAGVVDYETLGVELHVGDEVFPLANCLEVNQPLLANAAERFRAGLARTASSCAGQ
jgi:hypothetical protein